MNPIATSALLALALSSGPVFAAAAPQAASEDAEATTAITVLDVTLDGSSATIEALADGTAYTLSLTESGAEAALYQGATFVAGWQVDDTLGSTGSNADGELYHHPDAFGVDLQAIASAEGEVVAALLDPAFSSDVVEAAAPDRWVWVAVGALYLLSCIEYEVVEEEDADGNVTGTTTTYGFDCDFPFSTAGGTGGDATDLSGGEGVSAPDFTSLDLTVETTRPRAGSCTVDIAMLVQGSFGPEDDPSLQFGLFADEDASGMLPLSSEIEHEYGYVGVSGGLHHYEASVVVAEGTSGTIYAGVEQPAGFMAETAADWSCSCEALRGDLDGDGVVGVSDLLMFNVHYGTVGSSPADFDGDGSVGVADLMVLLGEFGQQQAC